MKEWIQPPTTELKLTHYVQIEPPIPVDVRGAIETLPLPNRTPVPGRGTWSDLEIEKAGPGGLELVNFLIEMRVMLSRTSPLYMTKFPIKYVNAARGPLIPLAGAILIFFATFTAFLISISWILEYFGLEKVCVCWSKLHLHFDPVHIAIVPYTLDLNRPGQLQFLESVDREIADDSTKLLRWRNDKIFVTKTWLIKVSRFGRIDLIAVRDIQIVRNQIFQQWVGGEPVEVCFLTISNRSISQARPFRLSVSSAHFELLRGGDDSLLGRIEAARAAILAQRETVFLKRFESILQQALVNGEAYTPRQDVDECLGGCGNKANIKIVKQCDTCEERDDCQCEATWCHICIFKWWQAQNNTRIVDLEQEFHPAWQAKCPTCRVYFCLNDVVPCSGSSFEDSSASVSPSDTLNDSGPEEEKSCATIETVNVRSAPGLPTVEQNITTNATGLSGLNTNVEDVDESALQHMPRNSGDLLGF